MQIHSYDTHLYVYVVGHDYKIEFWGTFKKNLENHFHKDLL